MAGLGILRQTARGGVQTEAPKRSTKSAVPAVVRALGEQYAHRLPVRVEVFVRRQERVDQHDLVFGLVANDRNLLGPVLAWLPVGVRRHPPGELAHARETMWHQTHLNLNVTP